MIYGKLKKSRDNRNRKDEIRWRWRTGGLGVTDFYIAYKGLKIGVWKIKGEGRGERRVGKGSEEKKHN